MIYGSLDEFLAAGVPELVDGKPRFKALFASYNMIGVNRPGPVITHDPRLSVTLYLGHRSWGEDSVMSIVHDLKKDGITPTKDDVLAEIRSRSDARRRMSQLSVGDALRREYIEPGEHAALFVYAGRAPHFAESVAEAVQFRKRNPSVATVVVTCGCGKRDKQKALMALVVSGEITAGVFVGDCGGNVSMDVLMHGVIDRWCRRHPLH